MFYDVYCSLCKERKLSPSRAAIEMGISKSAVSTWKNGRSAPMSSQLEKIANYFDVSVDYLLGKTEQKKPLVNNDEELTEYLEELKNRPELKMLFSLAKGATKADVEKAVKIIEALLEKEE